MGEKRVCVTGAAGFIASSLVQALLNKGYHVFGTLRSLDDENKTLHLKRLDGADKRLTLVKADILNYESLLAAMKGCSGVFHTASPVPTSTPSEPEVEVLDPAVKGTLNVLRACSDAQIKRVVFTSSAAAIFADPNKPAGAILDETFWSDVNYCRESKNWYWLAKTLAEKEAWAYAENHGLDMVVVVPAVALGPVLPPILNTSSLFALELLNDNQGSMALARNPVYHKRTKHINIQHHFIRGAIKEEHINLCCCPTEEMAVDMFTKELGKIKHDKCCTAIRITSPDTSC